MRPLYDGMMQSDTMLVQYMTRRVLYNVPRTLGANRVILRNKFEEEDISRIT